MVLGDVGEKILTNSKECYESSKCFLPEREANASEVLGCADGVSEQVDCFSKVIRNRADSWFMKKMKQ